MAERTGTAAARMRRLGDLRQLERITQQHDARGRNRRDYGIDEGELSSLVNEQYVNRGFTDGLSRKHPRRASDDVKVILAELVVVLDVRDAREFVLRQLADLSYGP